MTFVVITGLTFEFDGEKQSRHVGLSFSRLHRDDHEVNASRTQHAEGRLAELLSQLANLLHASGDVFDCTSPNAVAIVVQKVSWHKYSCD